MSEAKKISLCTTVSSKFSSIAKKMISAVVIVLMMIAVVGVVFVIKQGSKSSVSDGNNSVSPVFDFNREMFEFKRNGPCTFKDMIRYTFLYMPFPRSSE